MQQAIRRAGVAAVVGLIGTTLTAGVPAQAHDHTSGTAVTSFKRSNRIYWRAERHNPDLDRDNDRIACEKA